MSGLRYIACIPACNEQSLIPVLNSIQQCPRDDSFGVVIVINASENADPNIKQINLNAFVELQQYFQTNTLWFPVYVELHNQLPAKKAGVGLARKIAMDKACTFFNGDLKSHYLMCVDADCEVKNNWINNIVDFFDSNKNIQAASVYFEHPLPDDEILKKAIVLYELHLRYLKQALQFCHFPWYFHTVGSSMALRAQTYINSGGMNTRQAGEDYYFLHKLMPLGFGEINDTTVYPQTRYSDRVPFGTGRSMLEFKEKPEILTYNFNIFKKLKNLFFAIHHQTIEGLKIAEIVDSQALQNFLEIEHFHDAVLDAISNTSNAEKAKERLWKWFSGFRIIKCLHFLRDAGLPDIPVRNAIQELYPETADFSDWECLNFMRKNDRSGAQIFNKF